MIVGKKCGIVVLGEWISYWTAMFWFNGVYVNVSNEVKDLGDIVEEHLNFNGHIDEVAMIAWYHVHAIILIIALYNVSVHNYVISRLHYCTFFIISVYKNNNWISCKLLSMKMTSRVINKLPLWKVCSNIYWIILARIH